MHQKRPFNHGLLAVVYGAAVSPWIIPGLMVGLLGFGATRRVRVYEVFVDGARDGFQVALRIIPYLVAILVAVAMLRASGALAIIVGWLTPLTSASACRGTRCRWPSCGRCPARVRTAFCIDHPGPGHRTGQLHRLSCEHLPGSTETTFYVLAVYYGAVQVRQIRHTLAAALTADVAGIAGAVIGLQLPLRRPVGSRGRPR